MTALPFSATTPISIGRVGLRSRDPARLADYYKSVVGLKELHGAGDLVVLGTEERALLAIEGSAALKPDDPRSAGLFHTAFLLPTRRDLACWARQALERRIRIDGASDHLASEAIYLTDPEGNGIEIYADRTRSEWRNPDGSARIATLPLDFEDLLAELSGGGPLWSGAPPGSVVGHVHLRVGAVEEAEAWWNALGLDTFTVYGGQAVFLSSGGYHHHIGANTWQSRGAGQRSADTTGLAFVELRSRQASAQSVSHDPWGTEIRMLPAAA